MDFVPRTVMIGGKVLMSCVNTDQVSTDIDFEQSVHKSVERPAFLRQSCFVTQTNRKTEGGLGREVLFSSLPPKNCGWLVRSSYENGFLVKP